MALRGITPFERKNAAMAQLVERVLGKDEVTGSIPVSSSKKRGKPFWGLPLFMCRLIRVGDFGLTKDNQKGSRKRKRFREEEKAARKGYAFLKKHSEKSGFRRKDEVTGSIPVSSSKKKR